jgi:1-acyl-sn-glycerol-3-phosphate acyltransferase
MGIAPHITPESRDFPGDPTPQPPFGLRDSLRSLALWSVGVPHLAAWAAFAVAASKTTDLRRVDPALKLMCLLVPRLAGIRVEVLGREALEPGRSYVYVINHVNIFDMFAIYQAIPGYTRSLELVDHFSWPIFGPFITAAGQIPVDPKDARVTARGLKRATEMLEAGDSIAILSEGERTLDGSVGRFYPGAFRLAIKAQTPVAPMALRGGRAVSRRGDWRIRPGVMEVVFGQPIPTAGLKLADADALAARTRDVVIDLLQRRRAPGG